MPAIILNLQVGVSTDELDKYLHDLIIKNSAYPSPLLYQGFPKSICTSVNHIACHGIPDDRKLQSGDIVTVDVTVWYHFTDFIIIPKEILSAFHCCSLFW